MLWGAPDFLVVYRLESIRKVPIWLPDDSFFLCDFLLRLDSLRAFSSFSSFSTERLWWVSEFVWCLLLSFLSEGYAVMTLSYRWAGTLSSFVRRPALLLRFSSVARFSVCSRLDAPLLLVVPVKETTVFLTLAEVCFSLILWFFWYLTDLRPLTSCYWSKGTSSPLELSSSLLNSDEVRETDSD